MHRSLLLSLCTTLTLFATQAPQTFNKSFGGDEDDVASSVIKTDDGYLIAGKTKSFTSHRDYDAYLIKLDKNGDKVWSKTYGGEEDAGYDIVANDDGYLIVGTKQPNLTRYNDVWVLKVDLKGKF